MKLSESIALHTPATRRVLKAGGVGSGPQLPAIQREIAQRMANHLKVVTVHTPSQSRFSPTPKLATPGKVGHGGSAPKAPSGGPKMTPSAPRPGGKIGAGGPGSGRHSKGKNEGAGRNARWFAYKDKFLIGVKQHNSNDKWSVTVRMKKDGGILHESGPMFDKMSDALKHGHWIAK